MSSAELQATFRCAAHTYEDAEHGIPRPEENDTAAARCEFLAATIAPVVNIRCTIHAMGLNSEASSRALVIAFRGSMCTENWGVNAMAQMTEFPQSWSGSKVHSGNYHAWSTHLKPCVLQELHGLHSSGGFNRIIFTGHSLGGAIATLAAVDFKEDAVNWGFDFLASGSDDVSVVTFGQPHSGNAAFKCGYMESDIRHMRLLNATDPVPVALAAASWATKVVGDDTYEHVGEEICLAGGLIGRAVEVAEQTYDVIKEFQAHGLTPKALKNALTSHRHSLGAYNRAVKNQGRSTAALLAEKGIGIASAGASSDLVVAMVQGASASALGTVGGVAGALPLMNAGLGVGNLAVGAHNAWHIRKMHREVHKLSTQMDSLRGEIETSFASMNEGITHFVKEEMRGLGKILELQTFQLNDLVGGQVHTHDMLQALACRIDAGFTGVTREITDQFQTHEMYGHWFKLQELSKALTRRFEEYTVQLPLSDAQALHDLKKAARELMDQVSTQLEHHRHVGKCGDPKRLHLIAHFVFAARAMEDAQLLDGSSSNGTSITPLASQDVSPPPPPSACSSSLAHNRLYEALELICDEVHGMCEACDFNLFVLARDYRPYLQQYLVLALGIKQGLAFDNADWPDLDEEAHQASEGRQMEDVLFSTWSQKAQQALEPAHLHSQYEVQGALQLEHGRVMRVFQSALAVGDALTCNLQNKGVLTATHAYTLAETTRPRIHCDLHSELVALFGEGSKGKWEAFTTLAGKEWDDSASGADEQEGEDISGAAHKVHEIKQLQECLASQSRLRDVCALVVQCWWRGLSASWSALVLAEAVQGASKAAEAERESQCKVAAAATLQCRWRGRVARDRMHALAGKPPTFPQLLARFSNNGRRTVEQLEPEAAADLVLETRDAICKYSFEDRDLMNKRVVILIGQTGSGKSTVGNWLLGMDCDCVTELTGEVDSDGDEDEAVRLSLSGQAQEYFAVGSSKTTSTTFLPGVSLSPDLDNCTVIDFPGFFDSNGPEVRIGIDLAFRELINRCIELQSTVHVLALVPIGTFSEGGKFTSVKTQFSKLQRHLPLQGAFVTKHERADASTCCRWAVGLTKCSKEFTMNANKDRKDFEAAFRKEFDTQLPLKIYNMNKHMLKKGTRSMSDGGPMSRSQFLHDLTEDTYVQAQQTTLRPSTLPSGVGLRNDCLTQKDIDGFSEVFGIETFQDKVRADYEREINYKYGVSDVKLETRRVDWFERWYANKWHTEEVALTPRAGLKFNKNFMQESGDNGMWDALENCTTSVEENLERVHQFATMLVTETEQLQKNEVLALEMKESLGYIRDLNKSKQCRLLSCWRQLEENTYSMNIDLLLQIRNAVDKYMDDLNGANMFTEKQWKEWDTARKEGHAQQDKCAADLGYKDLRDLGVEHETAKHEQRKHFEALVEGAAGLAGYEAVYKGGVAVGFAAIGYGILAVEGGNLIGVTSVFAVGAGVGVPVLLAGVAVSAGFGLAAMYAKYRQTQIGEHQAFVEGGAQGNAAVDSAAHLLLLHVAAYLSITKGMQASTLHISALRKLTVTLERRKVLETQ
jgi:hypothetical protein